MIAATDRLDRFWAEELGCTPEALYEGGLTASAPAHRGGPRWMGWLVPFECIVLDRAQPETAVISITPVLAHDLDQFLLSHPSDCLPPTGTALHAFIRAYFPQGYAKVHRILSCDPGMFAPKPEILPVSLLQEDDIHASWYRLHFDGPVFVARNEYGNIVSWAAVKCKSDDVWEMAVVTESRYRGMGLARSVVSQATQAALDAGKVPLYLHDLSNFASAKVCSALGYQPYGHELTCECGRIMPRRG